MQELLDAINRLDAALNESAARQAAQDIGAAIGNIIGSGFYIHKKTPAEIDDMEWTDWTDWAELVKNQPPAATEGPPGQP